MRNTAVEYTYQRGLPDYLKQIAVFRARDPIELLDWPYSNAVEVLNWIGQVFIDNLRWEKDYYFEILFAYEASLQQIDREFLDRAIVHRKRLPTGQKIFLKSSTDVVI
jgi:hypothetical protein